MIHGIVAGTDAGSPLFSWAVGFGVATVTFLTVVRLLTAVLSPEEEAHPAAARRE